MLGRMSVESYEENRPSQKRKVNKLFFIPVILVLILFIRFGIFTRIPEGYVGVVIKFEQATGEALTPNWYPKLPFITKIVKMETRIQNLEEVTTQAELAGKETVSLTLQMKYRLDSSKAVDVYKQAGASYQDKLIPQSEILDVIKSTIPKYTIDEFAEKRAIIGSDALDALNERFNSRGIIFTSMSISNYNFDSTMESAISAMNAATQEQKTQAIKIQTEKDRAAADKEIAITNAEKEAQVAIKKAEAEAEAIRIKAEAEAEANGKISASVTDELIRYNEVEKWNGSKATVITSGSVITDVNKDMRNDVKNENN